MWQALIDIISSASQSLHWTLHLISGNGASTPWRSVSTFQSCQKRCSWSAQVHDLMLSLLTSVWCKKNHSKKTHLMAVGAQPEVVLNQKRTSEMCVMLKASHIEIIWGSIDIYWQHGFQQHTLHTSHTVSFPLNGDILWNHIQSLWSRHTSLSIVQLLDSPEQGWQRGPRIMNCKAENMNAGKIPELPSFFHQSKTDINNMIIKYDNTW